MPCRVHDFYAARPLIYLLPVHLDPCSSNSTIRPQPVLGIFIVDGIRWYDDQKRQGGAPQPDPQRSPDVLLHETEAKGKQLTRGLAFWCSDISNAKVNTYTSDSKDDG